MGVANRANAATELPPVSQPGEKGHLLSEFIYSPDSPPTPECHASTIAETPSGLVAAWFGGTHEKHQDVGIWVSRLEADGWTPPVEVANGVQSMNLRYPCWNPVLFQPKSGPLMLFYKVGPDPRTWWGMLTTSEDGGKTWSWPLKLGEHALMGHLLGPIKNKPIQLADGAILCPSSHESPTGESWTVHFEITRDGGKTWDVIGPLNDGSEFSAIQPAILTYPNGAMQILCRTKQRVIAQSWSRDGGRTWEKLSPIHLPNPNAGFDGVSLAGGRQLLVYNHSTRHEGFPSHRNILNVALSSNGTLWSPVLTLELQKNGKFSYPAVIQTADGLVHITYTWQRKTIRHVVLDPAKL